VKYLQARQDFRVPGGPLRHWGEPIALRHSIEPPVVSLRPKGHVIVCPIRLVTSIGWFRDHERRPPKIWPPLILEYSLCELQSRIRCGSKIADTGGVEVSKRVRNSGMAWTSWVRQFSFRGHSLSATQANWLESHGEIRCRFVAAHQFDDFVSAGCRPAVGNLLRRGMPKGRRT